MSEWTTYQLGEITEWYSGGTPSKQKEEYWNGEIPWISARSLKGTRVSDSDLKITQEGLDNGSRLALKNDLLLLVRGSGLFNSIPISIVEKPVAFNQDIKAIRIKKEFDFISPWFLLYWFYGNTRILNGIMEETGIGAGKFDLPLLKDLTIEIPPQKELEELTKTFKSIDDKLILLQEQNQTLEELAQTLFNRWFVDFEFPNENGEPYKSAGGKMIESELGEIPEGWQVGCLGDEFTILMGQSPAGSSYNENKVGKVFYQGRTDFGFRFPTNRLYTTEPKRIASKFDVLVSVRAPVGDVNMANEECCIGRGLGAVKSNLKSYCFNKIKSLKKSFDVFENEGTVFGSLSKNDFNDLEIIIPDKQIAEQYDQVTFKMDLKILENTNEIQLLTQLRDTLLPKLMSGELTINQEALKNV